MLGGYQVIDFKGETLATATTIKGAFKKAKSSKVLLVENLGGVSLFTHDTTHTNTTSASCPAILRKDNNEYELHLLTITSADSCSIVVAQ